MRRLRRDAFTWVAWFVIAFLTFGPGYSGRNGSGVYTIPNTFSSGATITAAGHNQNFSDIATELTNSVAADGQTSMTGPLKASNGTVGAPSITFASDTDTGLYRIGANNIGMSAAGSKVVDLATTGVSVTGTIGLTSYVEMTEISTPSAASVNGARLYIDDNGVGKTRLMVIFSSGAAQVVATQP